MKTVSLKTFLITTIVLLVVIVLLILACIGVYKFYHNPQIVWTGPTSKTEYNKPAGETDLSCYRSPLIIDGKQRGMYFDVDARDMCKHAKRTLKLIQIVRRHEFMPLVMGFAGYDTVGNKFQVGWGAGAQYRYSFGMVDIGPGAGYFHIGSIQGAWIMAGASAKFN